MALLSHSTYMAGCLLFLLSIFLPQRVDAQTNAKADSLLQVLTTSGGMDSLPALKGLFDIWIVKDLEAARTIVSEFEKLADRYNDASLDLYAKMAAINIYTRAFQFDSIPKVAWPALQKAQQLNEPKSRNFILECLGAYHSSVGSLDSGIYYYHKVLESPLVDTMILATQLGRFYHLKQNYEASMEYHEMALNLAIAKSNKMIESVVTNNIAAVYVDIEENEKAKEYAFRSIRLKEELGDEAGILYAYLQLVNIDLSFEEHESYIPVFDSIALATDNPVFFRMVKIFQSSIYIKHGFPEKALPILLDIYPASKAANSYELQGIVQNLSQAYLELGNYEQAKINALDFLKIAELKNELHSIYEAQELLLKIYSGVGNYEAYHDLAVTFYPVQDSIQKQAKIDRLSYLDAKLEDIEQKQEITLLNQTLKQKTIRRNRMLALGLMIGAFLLLILYFRNRELRRQKKQVFREKKISRQLNEMNTKLKSLDEMKDQFFANISHELRTPLTLILGPVERLLKKAKMEMQHRALLEGIKQNADRLLLRVNEILDLAKLDAFKLTAEPNSTELVAFSKRTLAYFESSADQSSLTTRFECSFSELNAMIDSKKVDTILQNYISNAIKFTPPGGQITIELSHIKDDLIWVVSDTGKGVPEEDLEKVFERFYQGSSVIAEGGTGIGLALAKELAKVLDGKTWAKSTAGKGSKFYLSIPYKESSDTIEISKSDVRKKTKMPLLLNQKGGSKKGEILLVEDNIDIQDYIKVVLSDYKVTTRGNGLEALEFLKAKRPSMIISDIMMPEMDGFELLDHLKGDEDLCSIPVIMLTARAGIEDRLKALQVGVDDYLLKPFAEEELYARVNNIMERIPWKAQAIEESEEVVHPHQYWLSELEVLVVAHISERQFNLDFLADQMAISKRQLQRRIKNFTGLTASDYVREIRLHEAKRHLESGKYETVAEVSYAVGLEHVNHFSIVYAQRYGKRPVDYLN